MASANPESGEGRTASGLTSFSRDSLLLNTLYSEGLFDLGLEAAEVTPLLEAAKKFSEAKLSDEEAASLRSLLLGSMFMWAAWG